MLGINSLDYPLRKNQKMRTLKIAVPAEMRMIDRATTPKLMALTLTTMASILGVLLATQTFQGPDPVFTAGPLVLAGIVLSIFCQSQIKRRKLEMAVKFSEKLNKTGEVPVESVARIAKMPSVIHTMNNVTGVTTSWQAFFFDAEAVLEEKI